jgi:hypothetical protein
MSGPLVSEFNRFIELRRRLVEAIPDIDTPTLLDTLEGATDLRAALGCVVRSILDDETLVEALRVRLSVMKTRLERIEDGVLKKRQAALAVMEEVGLELLRECDFTASLRTVPGGIVITDEAIIPEWFWIPQPPKLDRRRIHDAIKAGSHVLGAELENSRVTLSIRTK